MVACQLPMLNARVRFPLPAPKLHPLDPRETTGYSVSNRDRGEFGVRRIAGWTFVMGAVLAASPASAQQVNLERSTVRGTVDGKVTTYLGIPYASPPEGPDRWRAPRPPAQWTDVRDANRYAPDCAQAPFPPDMGTGSHHHLRRLSLPQYLAAHGGADAREVAGDGVDPRGRIRERRHLARGSIRARTSRATGWCWSASTTASGVTASSRIRRWRMRASAAIRSFPRPDRRAALDTAQHRRILAAIRGMSPCSARARVACRSTCCSRPRGARGCSPRRSSNRAAGRDRIEPLPSMAQAAEAGNRFAPGATARELRDLPAARVTGDLSLAKMDQPGFCRADDRRPARSWAVRSIPRGRGFMRRCPLMIGANAADGFAGTDDKAKVFAGFGAERERARKALRSQGKRRRLRGRDRGQRRRRDDRARARHRPRARAAPARLALPLRLSDARRMGAAQRRRPARKRDSLCLRHSGPRARCR